MRRGSLGACRFCLRPAHEVFAGIVRCRECARDAVDDPDDLGLPTKRVVHALACGGAHLNTTVRVRLRVAARFPSPQELDELV